jgi:hypothetical protein
MTRLKLRSMSLALCVLVVGILAIGAGSAQAETGAFWLVSGKKISTELLPTLGITAENSDLALLFRIANKNIHILCTAAELEETHLVEPNGGLLGKIKFSGCKFLELPTGGGAPKEIKACNPPGGVILSLKFKGLITLHNGEDRITLSPFELNLMHIILSPECAFGEKITIGGNLVLKDCQNAFLTDQVTHLFEEDKVLSTLWANSQINVASIDGSFNIFLTGAHAGLTWAGHSA